MGKRNCQKFTMISALLILGLVLSASAGSCGNKPFSAHESFVVGGHAAAKGAWPWQASLQLNSGFHFCGGSLIHPQWVLTASHCVDGQSPSRIQVVLGEHNQGFNEGTEQIIKPSQIIMHERYKQGGWMYNDVALIKLQKPAQLNKYVGLVCLADRGEDEQGNDCFIGGWGYTRKTSNSGGISPKILQEVSGRIWRWSDCRSKWSQANFQLNPDVYCFGNDNGRNYGVCNGDSGGPLSCRHGSTWKVVGVAHFAETRCQSLPGAYTKVEPYLDWIKARVPIGETPNPHPRPTSDPRPRPTPKPDQGKTEAPIIDGGDFSCKRAGDFVAVKGDCKSFIICTSNGSGVKQDCIPGLHFNPAVKTCDWPHNVHRSDSVIPSFYLISFFKTEPHFV